MINVCDIQVMKPLLAEHGFHFSKAKGQNFLIASWVPASIAQESGVDEHTGVLEIGPGIGPLTQQLGLRAAKVCAVEVDTRLAPILDKTVGELPNVEILWGDVLKQDIPALVAEKFPGLRPMACANLPYYITTPILSALLEADCFDAVTVMVQKEVAQRIAADPGTGDYGAFSVFCQYYTEPKLLSQLLPAPTQGDLCGDHPAPPGDKTLGRGGPGYLLSSGPVQLCHAAEEALQRPGIRLPGAGHAGG